MKALQFVTLSEGGQIVGDARKQLEDATGKKVVSGQNFLPEKKIKKLQ